MADTTLAQPAQIAPTKGSTKGSTPNTSPKGKDSPTPSEIAGTCFSLIRTIQSAQSKEWAKRNRVSIADQGTIVASIAASTSRMLAAYETLKSLDKGITFHYAGLQWGIPRILSFLEKGDTVTGDALAKAEKETK